MPGHSHVWRPPRGVTLVELVVVMLLMGVLGAVGYARFFDRGGFDLESYAETSRAAIRYAQKLAIAQNRPVYVFLDGAGFRLCHDATLACAVNQQVLAPGSGNSGGGATVAYCGSSTWYCEANPPTFTSTFSGPSNYFSFDALGRPVDANGNTTFGQLTLTIAGGDGTRTLKVSGETGYVE